MTFLHALRRPTCLRASCRMYANSSAPEKTAVKPAAAKKPSPASIGPSACSEDTVLTGLNYLKGQPTVLALPDKDYPEWLWTVLQPKVYEDDGPGGKLERVKRRAANRQAIMDRNFMQTQ
ncbi:hypothetical protein K443DRAFT_671401 [Laccaria amethystina LaAM-08-1]|uniref:Large ribosomal subunit protein mL54 n=1 Tax=Laccaria amethystina LaAM-08-1 TaxID=1095629 RepID=A0A0C9YGM7_9AGAR|nr:hypothetical protein K443DRAFT_671401 [Laccaria amethystina LaAM-08-1]